MANGKISSMIRATEEKPTDLFEISQEDAGDPSGYVTRATTMSLIAGLVAEGLEFQNLTTAVKTLVGAINELANLRTFNAGDTIRFPSGSAVFSGYVTNSGKNLIFYVPLPKPPKGVSDATITGHIAARTSEGLANGGALTLSNYTVTSSVTNYGVYIIVQSETAFTNAPNNTTISVSPSSSGSSNGLSMVLS